MEIQNNQKTKVKMAVLSPYVSIITLNMTALKSPIKRHRVPTWINKRGSNMCCLQDTHFSSKDTHSLKVKGWKIILQANGIPKSKCGHTYMKQNKLQAKKGKRDKGVHTSRRHNNQIYTLAKPEY